MSLYNASEEASAPASPASGRQVIYPKSTGWYMKNSAGVESRIVTDGGNASLLVTTATAFTATSVQVGNNASGTNGYVTIVEGVGARSGYINFWSNTGVMQGFIGYTSGVAASGQGLVVYVAGEHNFTGLVKATGGLTVTGSTC